MSQEVHLIQYEIITPGHSDWRCELFGLGPRGIVVKVEKGRVPCLFWRWVQCLCFGNKWIKEIKK